MAVFFATVLAALFVSSGCAVYERPPKIYDILSLIYQLCSADVTGREASINCTEHFLHASVSSMLDQCLVEHRWRNRNEKHSSVNLIDQMCRDYTLVHQWSSKHNKPPRKLTKVVSIAALGRMACVLYGLQLPLDMWTKAFKECFISKRNNVHAWQRLETNDVLHDEIHSPKAMRSGIRRRVQKLPQQTKELKKTSVTVPDHHDGFEQASSVKKHVP